MSMNDYMELDDFNILDNTEDSDAWREVPLDEMMELPDADQEKVTTTRLARVEGLETNDQRSVVSEKDLHNMLGDDNIFDNDYDD